jgi:methyl-accepting chemotaxis protein
MGSIAVGQLDQMTQQNAALVEQSAVAVESHLREQAERFLSAEAVVCLLADNRCSFLF